MFQDVPRPDKVLFVPLFVTFHQSSFFVVVLFLGDAPGAAVRGGPVALFAVDEPAAVCAENGRPRLGSVELPAAGRSAAAAAAAPAAGGGRRGRRQPARPSLEPHRQS